MRVVIAYCGLCVQFNWWIRQQTDLQTLRHVVLCVLRGFVGERAGHSGSDSGAADVLMTLKITACVCEAFAHLCVSVCLQVFVETLDKCFENVCELDLIFHMDKVKGGYLTHTHTHLSVIECH